MKRTSNVSLMGVSALALMLAGCAPDGGRTARDLAGPAAGLEGTRVSGQVTDVVEAGLAAPISRERTLEGTFHNGVARTSEHGLLGAAPGHRVRRHIEFTEERTGRRHRVDLEPGPDGGPVSRIRASVNGRLLVEATLTWEQRDGVWVLLSQQVEAFGATGQSVRLRRTVSGTSVAAAAAGPRTARQLAGLFTAAMVPASAEAAVACWREYRDYSLASLLLAVATEVALASPEKVSAIIAWTLAWEKWERALEVLLLCIGTDTNPFPIGL